MTDKGNTAKVTERYASPVGGMAQLGPELDAMRADAAHYIGKRRDLGHMHTINDGVTLHPADVIGVVR